MSEAARQASVDRRPCYRDCYVAFVDLLGFSRFVERSVDDPSALGALAEMLSEAAELPGSEHSRRPVHYGADGRVTAAPEQRWHLQVRSFSDSVALFIPEESHALACLLSSVRYLHDCALRLDLSMRGAVTLGEMYWNEAWSTDAEPVRKRDTETGGEVAYERGAPPNAAITLGPGLVQAHELESEVAIYPRVVLSPELMAYLRERAVGTGEVPTGKRHPALHPVPLRRPTGDGASSLLDFIRADRDGVAFLDLLHPDILRADTQRIVREPLSDGQVRLRWERDKLTPEDFMAHVRSTIDAWVQHGGSPKVRAKHSWLANYFNERAPAYGLDPIPLRW
jgi:hypothetical protein